MNKKIEPTFDNIVAAPSEDLPRVALCMPVGPRGISAQTMQLVAGLVARGVVTTTIVATGHLIRARNAILEQVPSHHLDRLLWLDADVWTSPSDLEAFARRSERTFSNDLEVGWTAAACCKRDGSPNYCFPDDGASGPLWAGLGLQYWHWARYRDVGAPKFRWVEPLGEDYRMCDDLYFLGLRGEIDCAVPTVHDGVAWRGEGES